MHIGGAGRALGKTGHVSHRSLRHTLCSSSGKALPASNRKTCGKKHTVIPPSGRIFSGIRTKIRQHAEKIATRCGEEKCVLRQAMHALAEKKRRFCRNFSQKLQTNTNKCIEKLSVWTGFRKAPVSKNKKSISFCHNRARNAFFSFSIS